MNQFLDSQSLAEDRVIYQGRASLRQTAYRTLHLQGGVNGYHAKITERDRQLARQPKTYLTRWLMGDPQPGRTPWASAPISS